MRTILSLSVLLLTAAAAAQSAAAPTPNVLRKPMQGETAKASDTVCRDRIVAAREARGLPGLDREPASPDKPLRIYAVDKRVDGCSVLMMFGKADDIRPLPKADTEARLRPAR